MSPNPTAWRLWHRASLLVLFLSVPWLGVAKKEIKKGGDFDLSGMIRPDLLNAPADPTLRFPVMPSEGSIFGLTYGWLDISNSTIRYTAVQPTGKSSRSFEASRLGVTEIRLEKGWLSFKTDKKRQELMYLPQDLWGTVRAGPGMGSVANRQTLGTQSIYKTLLNFDRVVALLSQSAAPSVTTRTAVPGQAPKAVAAPAIVLSSPPGASENQSIDWHDGHSRDGHGQHRYSGCENQRVAGQHAAAVHPGGGVLVRPDHPSGGKQHHSDCRGQFIPDGIHSRLIRQLQTEEGVRECEGS